MSDQTPSLSAPAQVDGRNLIKLPPPSIITAQALAPPITIDFCAVGPPIPMLTFPAGIFAAFVTSLYFYDFNVIGAPNGDGFAQAGHLADTTSFSDNLKFPTSLTANNQWYSRGPKTSVTQTILYLGGDVFAFEVTVPDSGATSITCKVLAFGFYL